MSKTFSVAEARDQLAELLRQAEAGEAITIARRGKPVARLVSEQTYQRLTGQMRGRSQRIDWGTTSIDLRDFEFDRDDANAR